MATMYVYLDRYIKAAAFIRAHHRKEAEQALRDLGTTSTSNEEEASFKRSLLKVAVNDAFESHDQHAAAAALEHFCRNDDSGSVMYVAIVPRCLLVYLDEPSVCLWACY